MAKAKLKLMCNHPALFPTAWNQPRPEPAEMVYDCECGENYSCPVCGWGAGTYPCSCMRREERLRDWYEDISERYAGAWEALAKL
jgi:hypothetical protein